MDQLPPPGFYPDASDSTLERWWNGQAWSEATRPREGAQTTETGAPEEPAKDLSDHDPYTPQEWDVSLLPKSLWVRFVVSRPTAQVIVFAVAIMALGAPASTLFAVYVMYVPWSMMLVFLVGMAVLGYGIVFHSDVRRRYGFRGIEPGRKFGNLVMDIHEQTRKNERGY